MTEAFLDNITYPNPYIMTDKAIGNEVQDFLLDKGMIPIIQITNTKHEFYQHITQHAPPDLVIRAVIVCIKYTMNFEC